MEPRLTRDNDNAIIIEASINAGITIGQATLTCVPAAITALIGFYLTPIISMAALGLFVPIALLGLFRWWRVSRSKRWNDYWEAKQEKDSASRDFALLILPGFVAAAANGSILIQRYYADIAGAVTSYNSLLGTLPF